MLEKLLNAVGIKTKAQKKREVAVARLKMMSEQDKVTKKIAEVKIPDEPSNLIDLQAVAQARAEFERKQKNGGRR